MGLFTRTKSGSTTKTRNNKTGRTTVCESYRAPGGKTVSRNFTTGKTTTRQTRKP
jgi:hypothetical protein